MITYYWVFLAVIKIIVTVLGNLIQKYYYFEGNTYPIITSIIAAIFFIIYTFTFEDLSSFKKLNYPILIFFGFLLFIFLLLNFKLLKDSPHPGYFKILSIYELLIILFISYYFYNAKITLKNWIGFIFIIIGSTFLFSDKNK